jgi:hypothetical protein
VGDESTGDFDGKRGEEGLAEEELQEAEEAKTVEGEG